MPIRLLLLLLLTLSLPSYAGAATVLVYGDSLSAGYGLARGEDWAQLLAQRLREKKTDYTVANASISGETTLGGLNRIEQTLKTHRPEVTILALGANDGLRGSDLDAMRRNLERMIDAAQRAKSRVILVGMRIPPNYGPQYTEKFQNTYSDIAKKRRLPLVPFLLEGFAEKRDYFLSDNLHPTAAAQPLILDTVWKALAPQLKNTNKNR
ncbi:MAG: arylesterase [Burkholderiales bacterium]